MCGWFLVGKCVWREHLWVEQTAVAVWEWSGVEQTAVAVWEWSGVE